MVFLGNFWSCLTDVKPLVMFDVECRMALETMQGNPAWSWIDLWYRKLYCVAAVTSVSLWTCDSFLGDCP